SRVDLGGAGRQPGKPCCRQAAMLHLIKLSVGTEDIEDLKRWQAERLATLGRPFHATRQVPSRARELLDGGSIYWVIRGRVLGRQRLAGIEVGQDDEGRRRCLLLLEPRLVRTL